MVKLAVKFFGSMALISLNFTLLGPIAMATTILSKSVAEQTLESAFVGRIRVDSIDFTTIEGFPHRIIHFTALEILKGSGETGESAQFTLPGGPIVGTRKVMAVGGGMTSFIPGEEYLVFLKNAPSFASRNALRADEIPNVLVGWTAFRVDYDVDGQKSLRQAGTIGHMDSARTLSAQKLIRHGESRRFSEVMDEIARAAAE